MTSENQGSPEKEVRYPQIENIVFTSIFDFLEMAHIHFFSSSRKQHVSPWFEIKITRTIELWKLHVPIYQILKTSFQRLKTPQNQLSAF